MNLQRYLARGKEMVDLELETRLPGDSRLPAALREAMRFALIGSGKRIRPILVLAISEMYRADPRRILPIACAVELVHTCSLILDDLPGMDDAEFRRGKPAVHRIYGEGIAILAALGFLNQAYRILWDERLAGILGRETVLFLGGMLSGAIGPAGMISGQAADLGIGSGEPTLESLEYIHSRKTGSLFIASAEMAAIASGANPPEISALRGFSKNLGLAFQITDDLLDARGDPERMGKPTGQDAEKFTFVNLCGVDGARKLVDELIESSRRALDRFRSRASRLLEFADYVRTRDR
jgi:geranylgeranyl diphosphate synthase type II